MNKEKNILLATLGMSPMIIPEAFLALKESMDEVHLFTTENEKVEDNYRVLVEFFKEKEVTFTFTIAERISLPDTTKLNNQFAESLYQWYIEKCGQVLPYVCLSGGIKTIPAIMQKATQLFGAKDVFHVISDDSIGRPPSTIEEVSQALEAGQVHTVYFGTSPGWPSYRKISPSSVFSSSNCIKGSFYKKRKPEKLYLLSEIKKIQKNIQSHFRGNNPIKLPFPSLQLLPSSIYTWLNQPLNDKDEEWVRRLPKVELHCHLGGFATQSPKLNEVRNAAKHPSQLPNIENIKLPDSWPLPKKNIPLNQYMALGDNNGSTILSDPGCLKRQIELLYQSFQRENIKYAEVRCSPYNYTGFQSALQVLDQMIDTFQQLMDASEGEKRCHVNLIIIVTRKDEGDLSAISKHLALAITAASGKEKLSNKCQVVGVDLAGFETKETRASYYEHDFTGVHRCGLAVTAHAGENDDAEGIWQAVYKLNARRIGHALHLDQAQELMQTFSDRQIAVEMCPYANYQIKGFYPKPGIENKYPLRKYLTSEIPVTINTDNIGISSADLTENFLLAGRMAPDLTRMEVLKLIKNSIDVAFTNRKMKDQMKTDFDRKILGTCFDLLLNT